MAAVGGSLIALLSLLKVSEAASLAGYCASAALIFTIYTVVQMKQAYDQLTDLAGLFGFSDVAREATSNVTSLLQPGTGLIAWAVAILVGVIAARQ